jgi:hypothetical protein
MAQHADVRLRVRSRQIAQRVKRRVPRSHFAPTRSRSTRRRPAGARRRLSVTVTILMMYLKGNIDTLRHDVNRIIELIVANVRPKQSNIRDVRQTADRIDGTPSEATRRQARSARAQLPELPATPGTAPWPMPGPQPATMRPTVAVRQRGPTSGRCPRRVCVARLHTFGHTMNSELKLIVSEGRQESINQGR